MRCLPFVCVALLCLCVPIDGLPATEVLEPIEVEAVRLPIDESFDADQIRDELGADLGEDLGHLSGITTSEGRSTSG